MKAVQFGAIYARVPYLENPKCNPQTVLKTLASQADIAQFYCTSSIGEGSHANKEHFVAMAFDSKKDEAWAMQALTEMGIPAYANENTVDMLRQGIDMAAKRNVPSEQQPLNIVSDRVSLFPNSQATAHRFVVLESPDDLPLG